MGWMLIGLAVAGPWLLFRNLAVEGVVPILLAVFMIDFPLLVVFSVVVRHLTVVLDRAGDRVALRERSLFRDRALDRPLSCLVRAERETNFARIPFLPPHGSYHRAVLVVAEDRRLCRVPVSSVYLLGPGARRVARAINGWLGRPLDRDGPAA